MAYEGNFTNVPVFVLDCPAGKRMDEAIVKALGWHINHWEDETDGGCNVYDANGKYVGPWGGNDPKFHWSPSTDIKAAWKLIEVQHSLGFAIEMDSDMRSYLFTMQHGEEFSGYVVAETAPLAISRAFLLSRGIKEI